VRMPNEFRSTAIKRAATKNLLHSAISVFVTAAYLLALWGLYKLVQTWTTAAIIVAILALASAMAWLFNPLRNLLQQYGDSFLYGESYDYRQMVLNFARRMSNVLDLEELAEAMLKPIVMAVKATQASLLLPGDDAFTLEYAERLNNSEPTVPIRLSNTSPIVTWLATNDEPLKSELLDTAPEFKKLRPMERSLIEKTGIELLLPIQSKGKLVGILALNAKESGDLYSSDDIDLLMTLVSEAAIVIENAQLYSEAKEKAHIDELTGLFNHRYFHERLNEEIARCSRFGDVFSLLILNLDLFKRYNEVYGHSSGDEILKEIGEYLRGSVRSIDMAFRYGGDEFSLILPQTPIDGAYKVARRIRKRIESEMDSKGLSLTGSIGVASWPGDGIMREEFLQAADAALYYSKQAGRNRVCMASEVASSAKKALKQSLKTKTKIGGEPVLLSTIYALAATVDAKDTYTYGHSKGVSKYATEIAEALGFSDDRIAKIRAAALLHDIGKIGVPDTVLMKPGALNEEEWEQIRAHPECGVAILKHAEGLSECLAAVQYHHERYDGSGYPSGLKGEHIPLEARIMAVADAYDAMTSYRPYREGKLSEEEAIEELKRCSDTQFDSRIIEAFIPLRRARIKAEQRREKAQE